MAKESMKAREVKRAQVVRKAMYASSVFLVFNCVKWHLMV